MKKTVRQQQTRRLHLEQLESRQLLTGVVLNEIHFDPDDATEPVEFLELYNDGPTAVDLSGWVLDKGVDFTFPAGLSIAAHDYVVITQDAAAFQAKFGVLADGQWQTGDRLSNQGEKIQLRDALGQTIDEVDYQLGFPWPTVGGEGSSIELIHPALDNNLAGSWRSSGAALGLPQTPTTLLAAQDRNWRYRKGTSEASSPSDAWRFSGFTEDTSWQTGQTSIGYGDQDDLTLLTDMASNYSSVYLRNTFTLTGSVPDRLLLKVYVDDGAVVWINGQRVALFHVEDTELAYDDFAFHHDATEFEERLLVDTQQYLTLGQNTIAIHVLNGTLDSSDLSIDAELLIPAASDFPPGVPTPQAVNSAFSTNAAPQLRQLKQSVTQPSSGEGVVISVKATDPDGVQSLALEYQVVDPGNYIRLTDAAYANNWTSVALLDNGLQGDLLAGDDLYSVTLPGSLQTHRRLVRYRITATDTLGATITAPYADDPQPNFAYFVYDGVPDYTASLRPGVEPEVTYPGEVLDNLATYHLIANSQDVDQSQYDGSYNLVQFPGTLVYEGIVYDHIEFRNRGQGSTYEVGKNKWKINFLRGHAFQARDNFGQRYHRDWDKLNILPGTNPWWRDDLSTEGTTLFEPVAYRLYELAGAPAPHTQYFQFRVIDGPNEVVSGDQYGGDFWGLYFGVEQPDGRFLDERGLPDGNLFNMHGDAFGATTQRNQGSQLPTDRSDLVAFLQGIDNTSMPLSWWEQNLDFEAYFAWNLINHAVNNADIRGNENVNYYHNQETGLWVTIPWDLDLTFEDAPHLGAPVTEREAIRILLADHPSAKLAYENQLRQLQDLLLANNDAALVVQEYAHFLTLGSNDQRVVQANQAQWDYHPRKEKPGIWYDNFNPSLLPTRDFDSLVTYMQNFLSPGGYGYQLNADQGDDSQIPHLPVLSYSGTPGYARDGLVFQTSPFSDPQGAGTWAAMEWRVAEVHNPSVANYDPLQPYVYEIEGTWSSGPLATFANQITIPQIAVQPGKSYRARVRMQDNDGHWSHWSAAHPFQVTPAVNPVVGSVVISEINYHPSDPTQAELASGFSDKDDFEFIELLNVGPTTVSLSSVLLEKTQGGTEGVDFNFGSSPITSLAPNERVVVVEDLAAFQARYGTGLPVAGAWSGGLSNNSEILTLTVGGSIFQQFAYHDSWHPSTDNGGPTLQIIDPSNPDLASWEVGSSWRPSSQLGGTPGAGDFTPTADFDANNIVDGADFLLWQRGFGTAGTASRADGDGNGDGNVDSADLTLWQAEYGTLSGLTAPSARVVSSALAVTSPEASTSTRAATTPLAALTTEATDFASWTSIAAWLPPASRAAARPRAIRIDAALDAAFEMPFDRPFRQLAHDAPAPLPAAPRDLAFARFAQRTGSDPGDFQELLDPRTPDLESSPLGS